MSSIVTGDRYLESLVKFVDRNAGQLLDGTLTLKLNPVGLHYVQSRLEALQELESLLAGAPVDYLRAYVSDLGDHRALEQLRRILGLLSSLKIISVLPPPTRDPTPLSLLPFGRLKVLELRGCDLSTSAAKGMLQLRHSLEKLICHNSTDALRHVFASRIVDIKDSPVWKRLIFVSCACNGLVLMDESLQLLPVAETLDLSRNQFAKVAHLRKCTKLRHLDLGFNHLRSISSLSEVCCPIVKLVLRNNALTTVRGIENLKLLEGLDLSYNIISSFTELEILASLPCVQNLWLEGNPLYCARWYRAHVFSFFSNPEKLILDDHGMTTREYWERHIILASRQKQPSGYGFYFPAKDEDEDERNLNTRKRYYRLASIEDEERRKYLCPDAVEQESVSCDDSDNQMKEENAISDGELEIVSLMNKIEYMKKERSVLWLREFKEWMDQAPDYLVERNECTCFNVDAGSGKSIKQGDMLLGESSGYVPVLAQASEGDNKSIVSESDMPFIDTCSSGHGNGYFDPSSNANQEQSMLNSNNVSEIALRAEGASLEQDMEKVHSRKPQNLSPLEVKASFHSTSLADKGRDRMNKPLPAPLTAIDEIMGSRSSSMDPRSPPHYQEDILQRRLYLEEEFLQLSAESQSWASSDSDTTCSEDGSCRSSASIAEVDQSRERDIADKSTEAIPRNNSHEGSHEEQLSRNCNSDDATSYFTDESSSQYNREMGKQRGKQKHENRIASLPGNHVLYHTGPESYKSNGHLKVSVVDVRGGGGQPSRSENNISELCEGTSTILFDRNEVDVSPSKIISSNPDQDQLIKGFFHLKLADSSASETCQQLIRCVCIYQLHSVFLESDVCLMRSCKNKIYLLLVDSKSNEQEIIPKVLGCHRLEELREIVVGLGLQTLRVHMEGDATYLFLPKTWEASKDLFCLFGVDNSTSFNTGCSLQSWEQVQVNLLEKYICGSIRMGIMFYSMLLFWQDNAEGESWVLRSLFLVEGCLLVCIENLLHFGCLSDDTDPPYYSLESCCPIQNMLEMVVELNNDWCLTLTLNNVQPQNTCSAIKIDTKTQPKDTKARVLTWKLKWFSKEALLKFVAMVKAIHLGLTASALTVKCIS